MNGKGNNLLIRTITGLIFVAVVLAAMLLGRMTYLVLLVCVAAWCSFEFRRIARTKTERWGGTLYILMCMLAMWFFPTIGEGMSGAGGIIGKDSPLLSGGGFDEWDPRIAPAFALTVWANDVFAYLVGVAIGRHKMAPKISPHKSWEGFAGGIVGATVVAAVVGKFWAGGEIWIWGLFGFMVALAAVGGDLAESRFKRAAGGKDSGRLLPGHGGLLDRFDATLGAVPVAFLFFLITHLCR